MILRLLWREVDDARERVGGLERRDDAFEPRAKLECRQRLLVGRREIFHATDVVEPSVFWPDAGIVEAGRNRVRLLDLSVAVHEQVGAVAVQHARLAAGERGRMFSG